MTFYSIVRHACCGAALWCATGCVATKSDLQVLAGQVRYLESRVERQEDLVTEISGSARKEVLDSRREMAGKLSEARKQTADLLLRVQELETRLQTVVGDMTELQADVAYALTAVSDMTAQQAAGQQRAPTTSAEVRWNNEHELYNAAKAAYDTDKSNRADELWRLQLQRWPSGSLAANAHFWLGEIAYDREQYVDAVEKYLTVAEQFSQSSKAPAAYLKLAMSLQQIGETEQARRTYRDLQQLYPDSPQAASAKRAEAKLSTP